MGTPIKISVTVNGHRYERVVPPRRLLSDFLRDELRLTGTHVGCEHGVCGACTVHVDGRPTRACLMFAVQADGAHVETVESLAEDSQLHDVQQAFHQNFGLQCGFCTPGVLMTATHLLDRNPDPTPEQVQTELAGHLCRCTGYRSIIDSVMAAARARRESGQGATAGAAESDRTRKPVR